MVLVGPPTFFIQFNIWQFCQPPIIWSVYFLPFVTEKNPQQYSRPFSHSQRCGNFFFLSWILYTNFSSTPAYILLMIPMLGVLRSLTWEQKSKWIVRGRLLFRPVCDNYACAEFNALRTTGNVGVDAFLRVSDSAGDTAQSSAFTVQLGCKHPLILFSPFLLRHCCQQRRTTASKPHLITPLRVPVLELLLGRILQMPGEAV